MSYAEAIVDELRQAGFDAAIATATPEEVEAGAACGQLASLEEE